MSVNEDIADQVTQHRIHLLRYEAGTVRALTDELDKALGKLFDELDTIRAETQRTGRMTASHRVRIRTIQTEITARVRELGRTLTDELHAALEEAVEAEVEASVEAIDAALPPSVRATRPADLPIRQIDVALPPTAQGPQGVTVARPPLADVLRAITDPVGGRRWTDRLAADLVEANDQIQATLVRAVQQGRSVDHIVQDLRQVETFRDTARHRLVTIARTEIQRVSNDAAADTYRANVDVVGSVQWLATLDTRTCRLCAPRHNAVYPLDAEGRIIWPPGFGPPPAHPRCRCFLAPVTRSFDEILGRKPATPAEQALDGLPGGGESFASWLRGADKRAREAGKPLPSDEILGPENAKLWRGNQLSLDQFSDAGRVLTKGELRALYPGVVPEG